MSPARGWEEKPVRGADHERAIEAELVAQLVRQAPTGFVIGTLEVVATIWVLWSAAPRGLLLGWLITMALLSAPAFIVVARIRRAPNGTGAIASWRWPLGGAYGLAGAGWGSASVLLYPHVALPYQVFLLFVLGGSGLGGMTALAPVRPAFVAYVTATFLPLVATLLAGGSI